VSGARGRCRAGRAGAAGVVTVPAAGAIVSAGGAPPPAASSARANSAAVANRSAGALASARAVAAASASGTVSRACLSGRGDSVEGSFAGFYREAYPRLAGRAIARGLSRDDAADAAQEALVGVYKRWAMLHPQPPECRFRYASAALENAVQNAWRRRGRDADLSERLSSSERVGSFVRFDADDGDTDALDLLRSLPERQRAVVLLLDEGWTPNEIAVRLRIGATSVRTHLQHARKTLRAKLQARKEGDRG